MSFCDEEASKGITSLLKRIDLPVLDNAVINHLLENIFKLNGSRFANYLVVVIALLTSTTTDRQMIRPLIP